MKVCKYHGTGNDFILIKEQEDNFKYSEFIIKVCDRHFGIGADGLMYPSASEIADIKMRYFNSDGTEGEMCGNGIRCFSRFVLDEKIIEKDKFSVETLAGIIKIEIIDDKIVKVDMGKKSLKTNGILSSGKDESINDILIAEDKELKVSSLRFGVPHSVIEMDDISDETTIKYGTAIELNNFFSNGTNANFVKSINENTIEVSTWERGAGRTLSCGTGSCASAVIMNHLGKVGNEVNIKVPGGKLKVIIDENVYLIGEAIKICEGTFLNY